MNIRIVTKPSEKSDAFHVRSVVFVEEQNVPPEIELDQHDEQATHFVGYESKKPIAASRLRWIDDYGKLERICVIQDFRGKSHGTKIIKEMESFISSKGYTKAILNAQTHAKKFYNRLGYKKVSEEFIDAGIPHITMVKHLKE